jgi:hypothetical protein
MSVGNHNDCLHIYIYKLKQKENKFITLAVDNPFILKVNFGIQTID